MEAIILVGGLGTRLQDVVKDVPKSMSPINGKPFLSFIFDYLIKNGIKKVILAVGYKKEIIINYYKLKYKSLDIEYSIEEYALGTGGALKKALEKTKKDKIFVINGDTFFKINFKEMYSMDADIIIAGKYMEKFDRYGKLNLKGNKIEDFSEKKYYDKGYINGGIYLINKKIFLNYKTDEIFSLEKDFFDKNIENLNILVYKSNEYFIDIGVPIDYYKFCRYIENIK